MNRGIYTIASGGVAAQMRLDTIAQNLSNVGTAGYKAERVAFDVSPLQNFPTPSKHWLEILTMTSCSKNFEKRPAF